MGSFSRIHPAVSFLYFVAVLGFTMIQSHPVSQAVSLFCAVCCAFSIKGAKALSGSVKVILPTVLIATLVNPLFNHRGQTPLFLLPGGSPLTLESVWFGASAGCMIATVLIWFICLNEIITSDKILYLFGKTVPSLSLVLSMTMRFVPRFKAQFNCVSESQRCMGTDVSKGNILSKTKAAVKILSVMTTWSLENAIDTADSMKSRGYGLKGRTSFTLYPFTARDKLVLVWFVCCIGYLIYGSVAGAFTCYYYPRVQAAELNWQTVSSQAVYFSLCITPAVMNGKEERKWKRLRSKI